jgi:hypothetical protein
VILSNFRKTRTKDRMESYRIESYRIFFKNTKKETENQTVELFHMKIKKLKFRIKTNFFNQILQGTIFLFLFLKRSRRIVPQSEMYNHVFFKVIMITIMITLNFKIMIMIKIMIIRKI